jgi:hypothetical protein
LVATSARFVSVGLPRTTIERFRSVPRDDRPALLSGRAIATGISTTVIAGVSSDAVKVGVRMD